MYRVYFCFTKKRCWRSKCCVRRRISICRKSRFCYVALHQCEASGKDGREWEIQRAVGKSSQEGNTVEDKLNVDPKKSAAKISRLIPQRHLAQSVLFQRNYVRIWGGADAAVKTSPDKSLFGDLDLVWRQGEVSTRQHILARTSNSTYLSTYL